MTVTVRDKPAWRPSGRACSNWAGLTDAIFGSMPGSGGDDAKMRNSAAELVALAPEVILATGSASMGPLMQISGSGTVPIVFVNVPDPVGAGYVDSLARPVAMPKAASQRWRVVWLGH